MKNFVQKGDVLTLTAAATVLSGDIVKVGAIVGVAATAAAVGEEFECQTCGVFEVAKEGSVTASVGDVATFANGQIESAGDAIGVFVADAANGETTAIVKLVTTVDFTVE